MLNDVEPVLCALFNLVQSSVVVNFTASNTADSPILTGISSVAGFFTGLPVFGEGVPRGASILSFDPVALTAVLDQNIETENTTAAFSTGFLTASRRLRLWSQVAEQPAIFLRHTVDFDEYQQTVMQKTSIEAEIWIYSRAGADPDVAPDIALNQLVKAVRNVFKLSVAGRPQTLGGLVQWARIEGETRYDPGDLDSQGKALIPIKILCP